MNKINLLDLLPNIDVSCTAFKVYEGVLKWSKSDRNENFRKNRMFIGLNTKYKIILLFA